MQPFIEEINQKLALQPPQKTLLFVALTCEKMYPVYEKFVLQESWGDTNLLQQAITLLYQGILDQPLNQEEVRQTMEALDGDGVAPDTGDFDTALTSYALDTCYAIYEALAYLLTQNLDHAINVATHSFNMIDMYVQEVRDLEPSDYLLEKKIENDPYMKMEKERQRTLINRLLIMPLITNEVITELRTLNNSFTTIDLATIPQ